VEEFFEYYRVDSGLHHLRRQNKPIIPNSIDFDIPSSYKKSIDGKRYLLTDRVKLVNVITEHRIIVFATDEQLRLLFTSAHVMMDGTFSTCPPHFHQVYSIHGLKNDQSSLLYYYDIFRLILLNRLCLCHSTAFWEIELDLQGTILNSR
jgi:hypothetical protein